MFILFLVRALLSAYSRLSLAHLHKAFNSLHTRLRVSPKVEHWNVLLTAMAKDVRSQRQQYAQIHTQTATQTETHTDTVQTQSRAQRQTNDNEITAEIKRVFAKMREEGIQPNGVSYNIWISCVGHPHTLEALNEMKSNNIPIDMVCVFFLLF